MVNRGSHSHQTLSCHFLYFWHIFHSLIVFPGEHLTEAGSSSPCGYWAAAWYDDTPHPEAMLAPPRKGTEGVWYWQGVRQAAQETQTPGQVLSLPGVDGGEKEGCTSLPGALREVPHSLQPQTPSPSPPGQTRAGGDAGIKVPLLVSWDVLGAAGRGAQWPDDSMSRAPKAEVSKALEWPSLGANPKRWPGTLLCTAGLGPRGWWRPTLSGVAPGGQLLLWDEEAFCW